MGCCPSSSSRVGEGGESDAARKEAKAKILTTRPSHVEMVERTCELDGMYEQDEELLEMAAEEEVRRGKEVEEVVEEREDEEKLAREEAEAREAEAREAARREAQEAEEKARKEAEEKARREAEAAEKARLASLTAAIGGTVARKKATPPSRVESLSSAAASSLDDRAALSAFTKYEDEVQQAASQLLARLPALARWARWHQNKGGAVKADLRSLASLLSMEEHTRNAQFMAVMHAGAESQQHMTPMQVSVLRRYVKHCSAMLDKLMSRIPLMPADVAPTASMYLSAVSQHRDLARAALPV